MVTLVFADVESVLELVIMIVLVAELVVATVLILEVDVLVDDTVLLVVVNC